MFTHSIAPAIILGAALIAPVLSAIADSPNFGQVATPEQIASWDTSIGPNGDGLPPGHGTATRGEAVYNEFARGATAKRAR